MLSKLMILKYYLKYRYLLNFKSRKQIEKFQEKQIGKSIDFAKMNSEFFSELYNNHTDFETLPHIDKQTMMDNFDRFNTLKLSKDEVLSLAIESEKSRDFTPKIGNISVGLSSGTSGHRGVFLVSEKEKNMWAGAVLAKLLPKGLFSKTRIAFFLRANNNLYESVNTKTISLQYFDMLQKTSSHLESLNMLQADILIAPPQVLIELAKLRHDSKLQYSPGKIISCAEVLQDEDASFIKKCFNINIVHQIYQCTEGFLAHTCDAGTIHINEDIVKIEKEYLSEGRFVPIITDFTRRSQPIIKYRLNDILVEKKSVCSCGSPFMAIEKIEGREDDTFIFENKEKGQFITVYPDFIRRLITYVEGILDYKVIQESYHQVLVQFNDITPKQKKAISSEFNRLAEIMQFDMPQIRFEGMTIEKDKKLRRIQRQFKH